MPISESIAIKVAWMSFIYAVAAIEAGSAAAAVAAQEQTIMGDATLRMYCIIGSAVGSVLSIAVFLPTPEKDSKAFIRDLAVKFAASSAVGVLAGPFAIRYFDFSVDVDMVMCISGLLAATGVWGLHLAMPLLEKGLLAKVRAYLGFVEKTGE